MGAALLGVDEALAQICTTVVPIGTEAIELDAALGRTLAQDLVATFEQPPFPASSMDGYAVRAADCGSPGAGLTVVGESAAGHPFDGPLGAGKCVRIFTGAALPPDADAVVIQEDVVRDDDVISTTGTVDAGAYVRPSGGDFRSGVVLLSQGRLLTSRDLMLAAAHGETSLAVRARVRVGILATGDEVVAPGKARAPGQIFSSVPTGLSGLVRRFGGEPVPLGIAGDSSHALTDALARGSDCNVILTIGGASVGDHDLVHGALEALGVDLAFWKIAMRPGKPLMYGRRNHGERVQHFIGLPGNPVSGMICGRVFAVPLLDALSDRSESPEDARSLRLPLAENLAQNGARRHYMRARYVVEDGTRSVAALENQDSSLMRMLAVADCLIVRRRGARAAAVGEMVDVLPLDF